MFKPWTRFKLLFQRSYQASVCGHQAKRKDIVTAFGKFGGVLSQPLNEKDSVDFCHECLSKMSIRCAWCGESIVIGDPVTLAKPRPDRVYKPPEGSVAYAEDPQWLVGCLRWECASSGMDRAGFWYPGPDSKGYVHRVMSPVEIALTTGETVFVGDLSDVAEAEKMTRETLEKSA